MPKTKSAPSRVGKEILAYCTSCRMDLGHNIVAMDGKDVAKVHCRTCNKTHQYRAPKGAKEPEAPRGEAGARAASTGGTARKAAPGPSSADESSPIELEWRKLMLVHKATPLKTYSAKASFKLGDRIAHPKFGEGIVGKLVFPNKMEVIFQHDLLVLIHAGDAS